MVDRLKAPTGLNALLSSENPKSVGRVRDAQRRAEESQRDGTRVPSRALEDAVTLSGEARKAVEDVTESVSTDPRIDIQSENEQAASTSVRDADGMVAQANQTRVKIRSDFSTAVAVHGEFSREEVDRLLQDA